MHDNKLSISLKPGPASSFSVPERRGLVASRYCGGDVRPEAVIAAAAPLPRVDRSRCSSPSRGRDVHPLAHGIPRLPEGLPA